MTTASAGEFTGAALDTVAGPTDPLAGASGDTNCGMLAEDGDDAAVVFGAGRGCDDVQPTSMSVRAAPVSAALLVIRQWPRPIAAIADFTTSLWARDMTNA